MKAGTVYFSPDYFTAAERFSATALKSGARLQILPLHAKGPTGQELGIEIAWLGAQTPRRVLLHSSGLHGVEGFAGSAIQLQLLDDVPALPADTALVIVHILNPYGMAWLRRVNENNVDLNRNFPHNASYAGAPSMYARLDRFLNPQSPPMSDFYFAKAGYLILRYGLAALKQSVASGQYEFPAGLFFGGTQMEEGPRQYEAFVKQRLALAEKAIVIDVHTGLGKFAEDSLLVDAEEYIRIRDVFGERVTALRPDEVAYRILGGLGSMISRVLPKAHPVFIGQEFGTYSPVNILHALREENRWHRYGGGTLDHPTKEKLKETFCPASESWRQAVLRRGRELVEQALRELMHA